MSEYPANSSSLNIEENSNEIQLLNSKIYQLEHLNGNLIQEVTYLRTILTSFNLETSTRVHQLFTEGVIKNELVYRIMNLVDLSLFDDTSAINCIEDHAKLLSQLEPYIKSDAKVLVLINSFSGFYFVAFALMTGRDFDRTNEQNTSSKNCGCVIGRAKREDIKVIKEKYEYLLNKGRIKLNAFAESAGTSVFSKGYPKGGPYDLILVPEIGWSNGLATQLKTNGVVVNPFVEGDIMIKDKNGRLVSI